MPLKIKFFGPQIFFSATSFITDPDTFVSKIKVPTLMFAGVLDTYKDCCVIERARELAAVAAKAGGGRVMLRVVEYPDAGHGFTIKYSKEWRGNDAGDAFRRTVVSIEATIILDSQDGLDGWLAYTYTPKFTNGALPGTLLYMVGRRIQFVKSE